MRSARIYRIIPKIACTVGVNKFETKEISKFIKAEPIPCKKSFVAVLFFISFFVFINTEPATIILTHENY
jgi:hypothetical protein